jgi:hypothetical protein
MQIAKLDPVDVVFRIFFPPFGTLIVYLGAVAAARAVTGGQPLSHATRTILRYGSLFILGMGYQSQYLACRIVGLGGDLGNYHHRFRIIETPFKEGCQRRLTPGRSVLSDIFLLVPNLANRAYIPTTGGALG